MKYYTLERYTDWHVMYAPSFWKKNKEYRGQIINELMDSLPGEEAPVIPCVLVHKHEDYRDTIDWENEGMERPPLEPPLLKDVIQISGMLSLGGRRHGGIAISQKIKNALENYFIDDRHIFYKFQLEYKSAFYDYYFFLPRIQTPFELINHIDFAKTEFMTKRKYGDRNIRTRKREVIKPREVIKVSNLEEYIEIKESLEGGVYNNNILYVNKQFDFFYHPGSSYFVSERFKNYLEKEGLEVTFLELSPASKVSTIIAPEDV